LNKLRERENLREEEEEEEEATIKHSLFSTLRKTSMEQLHVL
jgi:hypothetical protein